MFKNYINELKKTKSNERWLSIKANFFIFCFMCFSFLLFAILTCVGEIIHLCALSVLGGILAIISFVILICIGSDLYEKVNY